MNEEQLEMKTQILRVLNMELPYMLDIATYNGKLEIITDITKQINALAGFDLIANPGYQVLIDNYKRMNDAKSEAFRLLNNYNFTMDNIREEGKHIVDEGVQRALMTLSDAEQDFNVALNEVVYLGKHI